MFPVENRGKLVDIDLDSDGDVDCNVDSNVGEGDADKGAKFEASDSAHQNSVAVKSRQSIKLGINDKYGRCTKIVSFKAFQMSSL